MSAQKKTKIKQIKTLITKLKHAQKAINKYAEDAYIEDITNPYDFYSCISPYNVQFKAPRSDSFIANRLGLEPVKSSEGRGDFHKNAELYYEFKTSFTNDGDNLNLRQIRLYQDVDYYLCFFINEEDLDHSMCFMLTKEQMQKEVDLSPSYTHGTKKANEANIIHEYSITIPMYKNDNDKFQRWIKEYLSLELKSQIFSTE
jgi:hypothetical protein